MSRYLLGITLILSLGFTHGPVEEFHYATAQQGDGIFSLLRRYNLAGNACNLDKFYELNGLGKSDHLIAGKKYKLPVLIYKYNGESIRSTIGIHDWDLAKSIADYNNALLEKKILSTSYLASTVLWVPYHVVHCGSNHVVTVNSSTLHVPLFGAGYETVKIRSQTLRDKVFYIVSGHGGPDPGAMATIGNIELCEDEYAYDVSLRLARNLMENGATVHVIIQDPNDGIRSGEYLDCDKEELCMGKYEIPLMQVQRLRQRNEMINDLYLKYRRAGVTDQTVVCIHVDSRSPQKRQDVFFYHYERSKAGKRIALNLQKTFREKYEQHRLNGEYYGTVSARNLFMLKYTQPAAVYIELANIKNNIDRKRIMPEYNRQALANWLYEGLTR